MRAMSLKENNGESNGFVGGKLSLLRDNGATSMNGPSKDNVLLSEGRLPLYLSKGRQLP
jgi:hypothetical protein